MTTINKDNITVFYRVIPDKPLGVAISRIAENPYVEKILDRTPLRDMIKISKKYQNNPELYDDLLNGKLKFALKGLVDEPQPVFDDKKAESLKDILDPKSLMGTVIQLFEAYGSKINPTQRVLLTLDENILRTKVYAKNGQVMMQASCPVKNENQNGIIFRMIKAANDKMIELIRA
jgi:hypothetical protein